MSIRFAPFQPVHLFIFFLYISMQDKEITVFKTVIKLSLIRYSLTQNSFYNQFFKVAAISITFSWLLSCIDQGLSFTTQKMKFSIKDFFSKREQIPRKLRICSHLLKKFPTKNFIFCVVIEHDAKKQMGVEP